MTEPARARFSLLADASIGGESWVALAGRAEASGFARLLVADHPGSTPSPFVALGAVAAVTSRIALGPCVLNAGVRDPLHIASDMATLARLSGGRAVLGLGAGHTPSEWTMSGRARPSPRDRVDRLIEVAGAVRRLLAGETVDASGPHIELCAAQLSEPVVERVQPPLLIGGNHPELLRFAGERADIVSLSGIGRTLDDGHRHETRWSPDQIDGRVAIVRAAASGRRKAPEIEALVQHVEITADRHAAAERLAQAVGGLTPEDALACPFVLVGAIDEIRDELESHQERWGIASYCVRDSALDAVVSLMAAG